MKYTATLEKVNDKSKTLRTKVVEGLFVSPPEIGKRFELIGESLTEGGLCRLISTSPVTELLDASLPGSSMVLFRTEGCNKGVHYSLTKIKEVSDHDQESS